MFDQAQGSTYYFFFSEGTKICVCRIAFPKSLKKILIVLCSVELFGSKELLLSTVPRVLQIINMKLTFQSSRDVFQKRENSVSRMLVTENVENKTLSGCESVAVSRQPACKVRFEHPVRNRLVSQKNLLHEAKPLNEQQVRAC